MAVMGKRSSTLNPFWKVEEIYEDSQKAKEIVISYTQQRMDELTRLEHYRNIEQKCIDIMESLLAYYSHKEPGDMKVDAFRARMVETFIKTTQNARDELLRRYEIENNLSQGDKTPKIQVEFIDA